ncbi:hypothetical protein DTO006G1_7919 [Penicillium roqueforti]|nr:hypothetical protein CBS147337_8080 [Penicillium roqueforti]KAI2737611.1 hypothetical protein DTO013F2_9755 [Penicillium roqueforti]KAI2756555.1 hypothetical protein DTO006G1_7919 [Penicillium roqueforti]KAI3127427.1 hypothetical protein CBS147326_7217 [Penicillium roqueforti]KAI3257338.1 hypothetical protein DTO006G7_2905 [Penicillium roqueforti]
MSTAISNVDPLWECHSVPERIDAVTVNVPLDRLKELYPDVQRFTAMAVKCSYHPDSPSKPRALLIKRNGIDSSWGDTWEPGGGGPNKEDPTIGYSAARESEEETEIWPDGKTGERVVMRTFGFIINDNEEAMAKRVWSGEIQKPVGQCSVKISEEHLDYCWFTEEEVRSAALYVKGTPPGPFDMLRAKKDMVLLAFELFGQSQGQNVPPSIDTRMWRQHKENLAK